MKLKQKLLISALILAMVANNTVYAGSKDSNYNRGRAAEYAKNWATKINTKQYYNAGFDCTNFVSQCLKEGGKKSSTKLPSYTNENYWRPHSATWENANYFKRYWKKKVVSKGKNISKLTDSQKANFSSQIYNELYRGDVVQYGYSADDMRHSQICYSYGIGTLIMAQHSDFRKDIKLNDYIKATFYTYVRYYKMADLL